VFVTGNTRPWVRAQIHWEFMRREAHVSWPLYGPVLPALREGRLQIGRAVTLLPGCWITVPGEARLSIGRRTFLNMGVTVAAYESITIGEACMFANNCFITDADHGFEDPQLPLDAQGYNIKGPTVVGDSVWCGVNVAIMAGVTIGDHCVIGANSVVTSDIEPYSVAVGAPARVVRTFAVGASA
jgi:acetyltransferase-like isoleucine patch superfamily enzyme